MRNKADIAHQLTLPYPWIRKGLVVASGLKVKLYDLLSVKAPLYLRSSSIRKFLILFFSLSVTGNAVAPDTFYFTISKAPVIQPYGALMNAIGTYETMGNPLAFNELENAAGIFQIRQVRVDDYNQRTGSNYTLLDMFDYENSEKVFLYFAELAGPYNQEKIAKAWNGSGPRTEFYWKRIKTLLEK